MCQPGEILQTRQSPHAWRKSHSFTSSSMISVSRAGGPSVSLLTSAAWLCRGMPPGNTAEPIDLTGSDGEGGSGGAEASEAPGTAKRKRECNELDGDAAAAGARRGPEDDLALLRAAARRRWELQQQQQREPDTASASPAASRQPFVPVTPSAFACGVSPSAAVGTNELAPGVPAAAFQLQRVRGIPPQATRWAVSGTCAACRASAVIAA